MKTEELPESVFFTSQGDYFPPEYDRLRERAPIARLTTNTGDPVWYVTSHDWAREVLGDPRFSLSLTHHEGVSQRDELTIPPIGTSVVNRLTETGVRGEFMRHVGAGQTNVDEEWVRATGRDLLRRMKAGGAPADLCSAFAVPISLLVGARLLGLPEEDIDLFEEMVDKDLTFGGYSLEEREANMARSQRYMRAHLHRERDEPSGLLDAIYDAGQRYAERYAAGTTGREPSAAPITEDEYMNIAVSLFISTMGNPGALLATGALALMRHPEDARRLRERPELMSTAVDEILRYTLTMGGGLARVAREDVPLGDALVRKGELVMVATDAANYDPAVFPEPSRFDIEREGASAHLRFGGGRHHCPASQLSRNMAAIGFGVLLEEVPTLRLAHPDEPVRWIEDRHVLMPRQLPVSW
ncbi:cytochrome P450 [Streptomyces sp. AJS327]|uniref:cytochrome P450 n=1 Tax=Streptomyces sp. AJS327 TaxID=2545265 RepID=UPI0015E02D7F|nr:cytochrome P450 [Streptomyces sp. AJS327]